MFGNTKEKAVPTPPPALPEGVVFHVMPGKYQGVKRAYTPPPPPITNPPAGGVVTGQAPPVKRPIPASTPSPSTIPVVRPAALVGGKKMLVMWGVVALVVLVGGGLAVFFLIPEKPKPLPAQAPVVTPEPESVSEPVPTSSLSSEPTPVPEPIAPTTSPEPTPQEAVSSTDIDFDGLTDTEETLYTTQSTIPDTDSDGYLDGQEVTNLYNPTGTAPVRLADSALVTRYTNPTFGYSILRPAPWVVRALDEKNPREVLFNAPTGEFIQVIVDDNTEGLSAVQWYAKQFPDILPESLERVFMGNLDGVWTQDKTTVYLTKTMPDASGKRVLFGITYNYGERTNVNFRTTFTMMLKSFSVF